MKSFLVKFGQRGIGKQTLIALFALGLLSDTFAQADWQKVASKNGVDLYFRDYPNASLPEFKAVTLSESSTSISSLINVLKDIAACPQWVHQCEKASLLQTLDGEERYIYQVNDLPFFFKSRDLILHTKLETLVDEGEYRVSLVASPDFCKDNPLPACAGKHRTKKVRVKLAKGLYHLKKLDTGEVRITWQQFIDPAAPLPDWLIKSQLKAIPVKTLVNLRRMAKQERYQ